MTGKLLSVAICVALFVATSGCFSSKASRLEQAKAEAKAAKDEATKTKVELDLARQRVVKLEAELELARLELAKSKGATVPNTSPNSQPDAPLPIEQRLKSLSELYGKNAITADEWSKAKIGIIEQAPSVSPLTETRTLGQQFLDLIPLYATSAITATEWSTLKGKLLAQTQPEKVKPVNMEKELLDLQTAYGQNAITADEWAKAKAEVVKRAK